MKKAEKSFISSTFWTERIGYLAALKTIATMKKKGSWKTIIKAGKYYNTKLMELANECGVQIEISGIESIS